MTETQNAELASLEALLGSRLRNELQSVLDPELVSIAFKIGKLYVKSGVRRFRALIDAMMGRMSLSLELA